MSHVLFLQNAWSPHYAGREWPREWWLRALAASRSGQRLRILIDDFSICENTTPICGATPDSIVPPDPEHILAILERRKPSVVIACGQQAERALAELWPGALLAIPHPANRVVTNALYQQARVFLSGTFSARFALRQTFLGVERDELLPPKGKRK